MTPPSAQLTPPSSQRIRTRRGFAFARRAAFDPPSAVLAGDVAPRDGLDHAQTTTIALNRCATAARSEESHPICSRRRGRDDADNGILFANSNKPASPPQESVSPLL
eukprot:CAMPEP_0197421712 /NCGR_PEP_ID=MMETSP1170-20131217/10740_1 /TAXON_ID=54406 /ORGANISM="Sarcinochrysis sp, Strain CCMP770" /LENGTH=106 /DNA_ID=CAMNT_0042948983 /DNA_START=17 /DNA_END=337 /DNA_ORIENTATION=-